MMEYTTRGILFILLLISAKDLCALEVKISSNPVAVGENVTLELIPPMDIKIGLWLFENEAMVLSSSGNMEVNKEYRDRLEFDVKTWTLSLKNVTLADSGSYTIQGIIPSLLERATLYVQEPVSSVTVMANATDLVEFNDTVSLTCSASGSSLSRKWVVGSSDIKASERFHLSDDNITLTISRVLRTDSPLECIVFNSVSNATSQPVVLNISYGPDNVQISENPSKTVHKAGSDIELSCQAQSKPLANYLWAFDGALLGLRGPVLRLNNVHQNQSGNYSCWAHNIVTLRYSSTTTQITVLEPILNVNVRISGMLPIENRPLVMRCEMTGPVDTIHWLKDGLPILGDNRTMFSADNSSITFTSVQRSDDGLYQCEAFNAVSSGTSPGFKLLVNYGPEKPVITGPHLAKTGSIVTFTCNASSQPHAQYVWTFRGIFVAASSLYETAPLTLANEGTYTCRAFNSITGRNSSAETELTVIAPITSVQVISEEELPIDYTAVTLMCKVNGKVSFIQWLRDGLPVSPDNRTVFSSDNSTVTFTSVRRSDDGIYQCEALNALSNGTSPEYHMLVNYGPEQPVITGPESALAGSKVTFNCTALSQPAPQYSWYFNGTQVANGSIYETTPLTLASRGTYTCVALNSVTWRNSSGVTDLNVIDPITSVLVNSSGRLPINGTVFTLVCNVKEQADFFLWLRDGLPVSPDNRTVFSADHSTVTFTPVQRSDDGIYQCEARNALSIGTSPGYQLLVNCEYSVNPASVNSITKRNSSVGTELTVIAPIARVVVNSKGGLPMDDKLFTLVCEVDEKANFFLWLRDGSPVSPDNRTVFSADNSTVTFTPVQRSDDGIYQCLAGNAANIIISPGYQLLVNYGPEQPVIKRQGLAVLGATVTFTCTALSQPPPQYSWYFNGTMLAHGAMYETVPLTFVNQGTYTCQAYNPITGKNSSAAIELNVTAPIKITSVKINSSGDFPIDDTPFTLGCQVNGQATFIQWMKDGLTLLADNRTVFTVDSSSVTFLPVRPSDNGIYQCEARNVLSNGTSPEYHMLVNYGPMKTVITGPNSALTGAKVTFTCAALSQPPSRYSWYFNGTHVANGSVYETGPLTFADRGTYTCDAFNSLTGIISSAKKDLKVTDSTVLLKGSLCLTALSVGLLQLTGWLLC
ncbi:hypothetical protein GJAV_G00005890 [Gymnothorax javanicus]|nr:hypothetical protein GJAV_G00005890 [Gymnothorax javanicus]